MKEKQPKPKSVDECWMVEDESLNFLPILSATTFARAEALVKHLIFSDRHMQIVDSKYRIRKWRAETVCEWREDKSDSRCYLTGCGVLTRYGNKFCGNCGGKIRVKS